MEVGGAKEFFWCDLLNSIPLLEEIYLQNYG